MDKFVIHGGRPLRGTVKIGGSKNASLPVLIATLLTDEPCVVRNVPRLRDILTTFRILEFLGKRVEYDDGVARVFFKRRAAPRAPYELVRQMRASVLVAGPLLARFGEARVPLPGGCAIGIRPIDMHLRGFERLGARVSQSEGNILISARRLVSRRIRLRFPSVGATEDLMMAAAGIEGVTVIENAACEPEIADLGDFLSRMGAAVEGAGTGRVRVRGRRTLAGAECRIEPDRIEAGTFLILAAITGGNVTVAPVKCGHLDALMERLKAAGAKITVSPVRPLLQPPRRPGCELMSLTISVPRHLKGVDVCTQPFPGFPTDLQAPWMALMCFAKGRSRIRERIFEKRFIHAAELARMGGKVSVRGGDGLRRGHGEAFWGSCHGFRHKGGGGARRRGSWRGGQD